MLTMLLQQESPVLGTSGQEELAKRLAELELSRELFDVLGDDQDWFDEDFGLSSRKQQQKQKCQQQQDGISSSLSLGVGEQVKTPPRPELPMQMKQPEEPAMIVPHTVQEVEKLVIAATQEIWKSCKLGHGRPSLTGVPKPQPSNIFLEGDSKANDLEAQCQQSYKLVGIEMLTLRCLFNLGKVFEGISRKMSKYLCRCIYRPFLIYHGRSFKTSMQKIQKLISHNG